MDRIEKLEKDLIEKQKKYLEEKQKLEKLERKTEIEKQKGKKLIRRNLRKVFSINIQKRRKAKAFKEFKKLLSENKQYKKEINEMINKRAFAQNPLKDKDQFNMILKSGIELDSKNIAKIFAQREVSKDIVIALQKDMKEKGIVPKYPLLKIYFETRGQQNPADPEITKYLASKPLVGEGREKDANYITLGKNFPLENKAVFKEVLQAIGPQKTFLAYALNDYVWTDPKKVDNLIHKIGKENLMPKDGAENLLSTYMDILRKKDLAPKDSIMIPLKNMGYVENENEHGMVDMGPKRDPIQLNESSIKLLTDLGYDINRGNPICDAIESGLSKETIELIDKISRSQPQLLKSEDVLNSVTEELKSIAENGTIEMDHRIIDTDTIEKFKDYGINLSYNDAVAAMEKDTHEIPMGSEMATESFTEGWIRENMINDLDGEDYAKNISKMMLISDSPSKTMDMIIESGMLNVLQSEDRKTELSAIAQCYKNAADAKEESYSIASDIFFKNNDIDLTEEKILSLEEFNPIIENEEVEEEIGDEEIDEGDIVQ